MSITTTDPDRVSIDWDTIDPGDDAPYTIDYSGLLASGDQIQTSSWNPVLVGGGGSSTLSTHTPTIITPAKTSVQVFVKPNNAPIGQSYAIVNTIVTTGGATFTRAFGVTIRPL